MRYKITGEYPAPDFFGINERTGAIYISRDLRLDSLQLNSYTVSQFILIFLFAMNADFPEQVIPQSKQKYTL